MSWLLSLAATLFLLFSLNAGVAGSRLLAEDDPGITIDSGFKISRVATDKIASNIFCMAVDPLGRVFVSGPGYIKVLVDSDGDGVFEDAVLFSERLKSGAQGLAFDGTDIFCTGDGGIWKFSDVDRNGVADAPPEKMLAIKTGGEHDAHAIRKGADGWWYLLAGNGTPVLPDYNSIPSAPIKNPRAGFLMRISSDWSKKEIFAHGFRNAYDFDFAGDGSVFVFDSDGERDISLPWYRPTRVFQIHAGDDAGWVAAGWKRPDYFFDMPLVVGSLGRGSPTGVKVAKPKVSTGSTDSGVNTDAIFVADWTFGRVLVSRRSQRDRNRLGFQDFAVAKGQTGFAVTDLDFDSAGDLLISVGGRGTEGGVYRITPQDRVAPYFSKNPLGRPVTKDPARRSVDVIPREVWLSKWLNSEISNARPEVLLRSLIGWTEADLQSRYDEEQIRRLSDYLNKSVVGMDSSNAVLWMSVFSNLGESILPFVETWPDPVKLACRVSRQDGNQENRVGIFEDILNSVSCDKPSLFLIRLGQLVMGGCGGEKVKPMFAGYTPNVPLEMSREKSLEVADEISQLLKMSRQSELSNAKANRTELGRLAALVGVGSSELFTQMCIELAKPNLTLQERIHWLNCLASISSEDDKSTNEERAAVALSLASIAGQVQTEQLATDRNFKPRLRSLFQRLKKAWGASFEIQLASELSGEGEQLFFVREFSKSTREILIPKVLDWIRDNPDAVGFEHLDLLGSDGSVECLEVVRNFSNRRDLRPAVIANLISSPQLTDSELFRLGLESRDVLTVKNSAIGLRRISQPVGVSAILAASNALIRMSWDKSTVSARDQLVMFLENETQQKFGYKFKSIGGIQVDVLDRISRWIEREYPEEFLVNQQQQKSVGRRLSERIAAVDWSRGNAERGASLYKNLQCARCHDAGSRLGPRLEGLGKRFSRDDLFRAIIYPNEQVPERYRAVAIETVDGQYIQGAMVYESVDGITLQQTDGKTRRINRDQIEFQMRSDKSLMPEGLLDYATDGDLADLYEYLSK